MRGSALGSLFQVPPLSLPAGSGACCSACSVAGDPPSPLTPGGGGAGKGPPTMLLLTFSGDPFEGQKFDSVGGVLAPSLGKTVCADSGLAPMSPAPCGTHSGGLASGAGAPKPQSRASFGVGGPPNQTPSAARSLGILDLGTLSCFQRCVQKALDGERAARVRSTQTQGAGPASLSGISRLTAQTVAVSRLPGEGAPRGRDGRLGPAAGCAGLLRVRSGTFLASGGFDASLTPHDFRSSIMDPREFLPGLKGITQIAETWLSGSGRDPTSQKNRNFS